MKKDTNLRLFILSQGLKQQEFFAKINPYWRGKIKPPHTTACSRIVNGDIPPPNPQRFWSAIKQVFDLNEISLKKLQGKDPFDFVDVELTRPVREEDLEKLIDIKKVMGKRFTLDFAIKTLKELSKQKI